MGFEQLFLVILVANVAGFGGLSSLPIVRSQLVGAGLSADALLLHAFAVGQISPGPNGLYMIALGYFVAGMPGAAAALLGILAPPLLVLGLERARSRLLHLRRFRAALHSLGLAVVALLVVSSATLVLHAATDLLGGAMVLFGAALLLCGVPSLVGILGAIVAGLLLG